MERNNASLFMLVSNSKKRPNNVILGRTFENSMLDMAEVSLTNFKPLKLDTSIDITPGGRPVVLF